MRTLTVTRAIVAAAITRFSGSIMHTDDGDSIDLGHAFLTLNTPIVGDYIVRGENDRYYIRSAQSMEGWEEEEVPTMIVDDPPKVKPKRTRKKKVANPPKS